MSLSVQYETIDEAEMRLNGTIVLYDGEPVYITNVNQVGPGDPKQDIFRVYAAPLPYKGGRAVDEFRKFISSKKFDLSTIKMGFCNRSNGELTYLSRAPKKQYKQGVASTTLRAESPWKRDNQGPLAKFRGEGNRLQDFNELIADQAFVDCIKGVYPSFEKCKRELAKDEVTGMAFSRECALVKDEDIEALLYLYYKTEKVGFVLNDQVTLSKKVGFLQEALRELGLRL